LFGGFPKSLLLATQKNFKMCKISKNFPDLQDEKNVVGQKKSFPKKLPTLTTQKNTVKNTQYEAVGQKRP